MRNAGRGSVLNPLFKLAVLAGAEVVIRFHIGRGDDINAQDDDGRSPLLLAALRGNATACRLLLEAGANPLLADNEGKDALAVANTKGFVEVAGAISDHLTRKDPATIPETALPAIDQQDRSDQLTTVHHDTKTAAPPASDRQDINDIPTTADRDTFSETTPPPVNGQRDVTNYQTTADHTTIPETTSPPASDRWDVTGWEEDKDTPVPPHDVSVGTKAAAVQADLARHVPLDTADDWSEVDIFFPSFPRGGSGPTLTSRQGIA